MKSSCHMIRLELVQEILVWVLYFLPVEWLLIHPVLSKTGQCLHADRLHLGIEILFLPDNHLISGRSLVTRMSCKFLGHLYPIIGCTSTSFLVPELLYRIGHNSNSHSLIGGILGLKSKIRNSFFSASSLIEFDFSAKISFLVNLFVSRNAFVTNSMGYPLIEKYADSFKPFCRKSSHSVQFLLILRNWEYGIEFLFWGGWQELNSK